jgi:hypothetical protein
VGDSGSVTLLSPAQVDANAQAESARLEQEDVFFSKKRRRWLGRCPHGGIHYCDFCLAEDIARCHGLDYQSWLVSSGHPLKDKDGDDLVWFLPTDASSSAFVPLVKYLVPIGGHFEVVSFAEAERKRKYIDWHKVSVFGMCSPDAYGGYLLHPFCVQMLEEVIFPRMTPNTVADFVAFLKAHFDEWDSNPARLNRLAARAEEIAMEEGYPFSDLRVPHPIGHRRSARESARRRRSER